MGGGKADIRQFWGWTTGLSFISIDQYDIILGEPLASAQQRMLRWAREREDLIARLATVLGEGERLTDDDVAAFVAPR